MLVHMYFNVHVQYIDPGKNKVRCISEDRYVIYATPRYKYTTYVSY